MTSWIMRCWLESHDESEWPDLTICQTEDACHVTDMKNHPSKEVIEKMCSDEFFAKHKYKYVGDPTVTTRNEEDVYYSINPKVGNSEANERLDISSEYEAAYISPDPVERENKFMPINQEPRGLDGNESGYLSPVAMEAEQRRETKHHTSNQGLTEGIGSKRSHTEIHQAKAVSRRAQEATYSQVAKIKKRVVEYSNAAFSADHEETSWAEDAKSIPNYDTSREAYENAIYILDQGYTSHLEGTGFIPRHDACLDMYEAMKGDSLMCLYQNAAIWTDPTVPDQLVPQSDHLYANMQEEVDGVTGTRSLLGTETGKPHLEARCQDSRQETSPQLGHALHDIASKNSAGVSEQNSIGPSWLNDSKLEVTFYV